MGAPPLRAAPRPGLGGVAALPRGLSPEGLCIAWRCSACWDDDHHRAGPLPLVLGPARYAAGAGPGEARARRDHGGDDRVHPLRHSPVGRGLRSALRPDLLLLRRAPEPNPLRPRPTGQRRRAPGAGDHRRPRPQADRVRAAEPNALPGLRALRAALPAPPLLSGRPLSGRAGLPTALDGDGSAPPSVSYDRTIAGLLFLVALAFQLPVFDRWGGFTDEGRVLQTAAELYRGRALYRDVVRPDPGPAAFYLLPSLFRVTGPSFVAARVAVAALSSAMAALLYLFARSAMRRWPALLVGLA